VAARLAVADFVRPVERLSQRQHDRESFQRARDRIEILGFDEEVRLVAAMRRCLLRHVALQRGDGLIHDLDTAAAQDHEAEAVVSFVGNLDGPIETEPLLPERQRGLDGFDEQDGRGLDQR